MPPARSAPSALRNRAAILEVLRRHLPGAGTVLEIASGTGEHAVHFAAALPALAFQPTDPDAPARESIAAHAAAAGLPNLRPPLDLDVAADPWPLPAEAARDLCAVVCINMIHISPWEAARGLMRGAGALLAPGGVLFLYGPFRRGGRHTAPSNAEFDQDLRARNSAWGVRALEAVIAEAEARGFALAEVAEMPANNLSVVFVRRGKAVVRGPAIR